MIAGLFAKPAVVAAWSALRAIPWWAWAGAALLLLGAWQVNAYGNRQFAAGADEVRAAWDVAEARHANQALAQAEIARRVEERHRAEYRAISERFTNAQRQADEEHEAVVAGLRAGTVRLRDRFRCPPPGVPAAPGDPGGVADTGPRGFGVEDAETALGIADDADRIARQLNALIAAANVCSATPQE